MRRFGFLIGPFLIVIVASSVSADWPSFWNRVHVDWRRNNCWPEPFVSADRELTRAPFNVNTDAGWRSEHTLSEHLFNLETHQLTTAGQLKARWIATQAPAHRRAIFVLRASTDDKTTARMASVHNFLSQRSMTGGMPPIMPTDLEPSGGAGDYFDQVDKKARESLPEPKLPERELIGASGS